MSQSAEKVIAAWVEKGDANETLDLSNMNLDKLPPLPPNVLKLNCRNNNLTELTLPPNLGILYCNGNPIKQRPELPQSIALIDCDNFREWMRGCYSQRLMWCMG